MLLIKAIFIFVMKTLYELYLTQLPNLEYYEFQSCVKIINAFKSNTVLKHFSVCDIIAHLMFFFDTAITLNVESKS